MSRLDEIVAGLVGDVSLLGQADRDVVSAYAAAVCRCEDARRSVDADGVIVADGRGQPVPHPGLAIERSAGAEMRAWYPLVRRIVGSG